MDQDMDFDSNSPQIHPPQLQQRYDDGRKMLYVPFATVLSVLILRGKLTLVHGRDTTL